VGLGLERWDADTPGFHTGGDLVTSLVLLLSRTKVFALRFGGVPWLLALRTKIWKEGGDQLHRNLYLDTSRKRRVPQRRWYASS